MILAINIGNTYIRFGCIDADKTWFFERISTDPGKTSLEYAVHFKNVLELYHISPEDIEGGIISSVAPPVSGIVKEAVEKLLNKEIQVVGPGIKTGINIKIDDPAQLGSNLVVTAVAAAASYPAPIIIIDMSTATTISVIDKDKNYIGGSIIPGLRIAMDSLSKNTSQLPRISLEPPAHIIGKNTVECMESGAVYGNACMLEGMIHRIQKELGSPATLVATGKIAKFVIPLCRHPIIYDGDLTLKGLSIIYEKNKKPEKKAGTLHRQAKRKAPCAKERNEGT